jgi:hypothetical protein
VTLNNFWVLKYWSYMYIYMSTSLMPKLLPSKLDQEVLWSSSLWLPASW